MNCHPPIGLGSTPQQARDGLERAFVHAQLTFVAPETNFRSWEEEDEPPQFEPDLFSFTALREPRARWESHYHQGVRYNHDLGRKVGLGGMPAFRACYKKVSKPRECNHLVTLADFLGWAKGQYLDNYMARYLLGLKVNPGSGVRRRIDASDLEAAKAVLDQMNFVLITERLGEAGCLLERLGWPPAAERDNIKAYDGKDDLAADPEVEALLDELNTVDPQLYAYAVELFEEQLAACAGCACAGGLDRRP